MTTLTDMKVDKTVPPKSNMVQGSSGLISSVDNTSSIRAKVSYITRLRQLLQDIGHRYEQQPPVDDEFHECFHEWMVNVVQPVLGWDDEKLAALEDQGSHLIIRSYPYADREMKLILSKVTALAIAMDDSLENEEIYKQMAAFSHKIYVGEPQPANTILPLYEQCIRELSWYYGDDPVLRGMGVTPWIVFVDAASLEKRIVTVDAGLRASPFDLGYLRLSQHNRSGKSGQLSHIKLDRQAVKFPFFLRQKTAISEGYAAAIFKAYRTQELPLTRYIKAIADVNFTIEIMNDLLSFHKEKIEGEKFNLIELLTQSIRSDTSSTCGGEWDTDDTFDLLCNQVRDAFERVDYLLRLDVLDKGGCTDLHINDDTDRIMDIEIARQWRGWRDGYISWHLESMRYKLDFLRPSKFHGH